MNPVVQGLCNSAGNGPLEASTLLIVALLAGIFAARRVIRR